MSEQVPELAHGLEANGNSDQWADGRMSEGKGRRKKWKNKALPMEWHLQQGQTHEIRPGTPIHKLPERPSDPHPQALEPQPVQVSKQWLKGQVGPIARLCKILLCGNTAFKA